MDDEEDFHSLNKGVFVIPFKGAGDAGPSRPLDAVYHNVNAAYARAHKDYEEDRAEEQLDVIREWLERCDAPSVLSPTFKIRRVPVALMQGVSPEIPRQLPDLTRATSLSGRDLADVGTATRALAVGFLGEAALDAKKAGRTPLDEVERWWGKLRERPALLVHVEQAQLVPTTVLAELVYIVGLHSIPIRLLFGVPSVSTFLAGWTPLDPSEIDISVLRSTRRPRGAVGAVLQTARDRSAAPITISEELAVELRAEDDRLGGGAAATLKSLRWLVLRHSRNSVLAALSDASEENQPAALQTLREALASEEADELLTLGVSPDLSYTQNPAPRLALLQALSNQDAFLPPSEDHDALKETAMLHSLWESAGKTVNLWDWLEGFRMMILSQKRAEEMPDPTTPSKRAKRRREEEDEEEKLELNEDEDARAHARFIRFVEEARLMGLVRTRGKKGDDVVKGALL
ncbi:hypothetical protein CC85DRAFT_255169 [Cutaneotrichosporon oleaginosum]|uniref:Origin recognition complex subunit 3 winged helix C-terminal domain-containing protein n=1 Tax=Cutaneotrichosporon oleaginosum TaxID=879819 RepID=A0A0J0XWM1_9TREE|nr:uncharacterized protein CC85DRAFT_255169 [Cutaneotrichosporon oleaginosum]KLT45448.1 hypothetical protein CC85DRAFT_255169 [Cutaneotrichosporon oleaginosum]TXT14593.1 hypothetical protein COLE_00786 [Cutaneotrichosporon oleaginosum]